MITVNGRKFVRNKRTLLKSLMSDNGATICGMYRPIKGGIHLYDLRGELFAFIVDNTHGEQFIVSAVRSTKGRQDKPRYMHGLATRDEKYLGLDKLLYSERTAVAQQAIEEAKHV